MMMVVAMMMMTMIMIIIGNYPPAPDYGGPCGHHGASGGHPAATGAPDMPTGPQQKVLENLRITPASTPNMILGSIVRFQLSCIIACMCLGCLSNWLPVLALDV